MAVQVHLMIWSSHWPVCHPLLLAMTIQASLAHTCTQKSEIAETPFSRDLTDVILWMLYCCSVFWMIQSTSKTATFSCVTHVSLQSLYAPLQHFFEEGREIWLTRCILYLTVAVAFGAVRVWTLNYTMLNHTLFMKDFSRYNKPVLYLTVLVQQEPPRIKQSCGLLSLLLVMHQSWPGSPTCERLDHGASCTRATQTLHFTNIKSPQVYRTNI